MSGGSQDYSTGAGSKVDNIKCEYCGKSESQCHIISIPSTVEPFHDFTVYPIEMIPQPKDTTNLELIFDDLSDQKDADGCYMTDWDRDADSELGDAIAQDYLDSMKRQDNIERMRRLSNE